MYEQTQSRQRFETVEVGSVNLEGCCNTVIVSLSEKFSHPFPRNDCVELVTKIVIHST